MRILAQFLLLIQILLPINTAELLLPAIPAKAPILTSENSNPLEISDLRVAYQFGAEIHFEAWILPVEDIQEVHLMLQPHSNSTRVETVQVENDGHVVVIYDLTSNPIPAFSPVEYWLRATTKDGQQMESPHQVFLYEDNRFDWQVIETPELVVKWYSGDLSFGQMVADVANQGIERAREIVNTPPPQPLRVYVYPTSEDLQNALDILNASWVAGHASPEFSTVLVSLPPGSAQRLEMERQLPHEITHILLYQAYGDNYARLPYWLNEGLASLSELYPNSDYARALQKASQTNALLPMESLCASFPREASAAYLAYAQSESFTRFLSQKFGVSSLQNLTNLYADGVDCLQGLQTAYDASLDQLETRWKQEYLGIDAGTLAWQSLLPYLVILLVVLLPLGAGGFWLWRKK